MSRLQGRQKHAVAEVKGASTRCVELPSVGPITGPSFSGTRGLGCHVREGRPHGAFVPALASQQVGWRRKGLGGRCHCAEGLARRPRPGEVACHAGNPACLPRRPRRPNTQPAQCVGQTVSLARPHEVVPPLLHPHVLRPPFGASTSEIIGENCSSPPLALVPDLNQVLAVGELGLAPAQLCTFSET